MPVMGTKQALCQSSIIAPKRMKLRVFIESQWTRLDIESSSSGAAAGAHGHRLTFFVRDSEFLGSQSFQRSDELFVVAPTLHRPIIDFLPHLPGAGRIDGTLGLVKR